MRSWILRVRRLVLPEPGLETRLSARMPWAWNQERLAAAY